VPTPKSTAFNNLSQALAFIEDTGFPVVIKPSDSSGQRGTTLVNDALGLQKAMDDALGFSGDHQAVIETYHAGTEINVTAAVDNGTVHFLSLSERVTAPPPNFGIATEHVYPVQLSDSEQTAIREACEKAIHAIGLTHGIAYPQVMQTDSGPKVLEIAVRIPGGHMAEVALHCSGIDMIEFSILSAMGHPSPWSACTRHPVSKALSVFFLTELDFPAHTGPVQHVGSTQAAMAAPGVQMARIHLATGQPIPKLSDSSARFGAVLALGETRDQACKRARWGASLLTVDFSEQPSNSPSLPLHEEPLK
jgi:biotin carboxylase